MDTSHWNYRAIVCDNDGTLVADEELTDRTRRSLDLFKAAGGILVLATGETVNQLAEFDDLFRFDLVIAENGALLFWPETKRETLLTNRSSSELVPHLKTNSVQIETVGKVIVSCKPPNAEPLQRAVETLEDGWKIIRNRDQVMVLPTGIDKSTGLRSALEELALSPKQVAAIGDGQNDICMLKACGLGVGLKSADPSVNAVADLVLQTGPGEAIVELIDRILSGDVPSRH